MVQCPWHPLGMHAEVVHWHWRRSALKSAGALQGRSGEFRGIFTQFYTSINFRGGRKSGVAPPEPPSSAPLCIGNCGPFVKDMQ